MTIQELSPVQLLACRGVAEPEETGCRFGLPQARNLAHRVDQALAATGYAEAVRQRYSAAPHQHKRLVVALAGCANGCSKPQIADLALVAKARPRLAESGCTGCEACIAACPDEAASLTSHGPWFDTTQCLDCGRCVAACREGALGAESGFQVLAGGRLGRRPRLATPVLWKGHAILDVETALDVLARLARLAVRHGAPDIRLGDLLREQDQDRLSRELEDI